MFESSDSRNVENWKPYFRDLSFLGKHYLVHNLDGHKSIARHYTVCNAMQPEIYQGYLNALKDESDPNYKALGKEMFVTNNSHQMTFCIKNYQQPRGLSTMIHNANARFEVKGPMGFGLLPKATGVHMVFAAGTGVLCFVDLVAELARLNLGHRESLTASINSQEKDHQDQVQIDINSFQLHLYVSYQSRSQSVALEMFEALDAYCKRNGIGNFHLHVRLSQEKKNPGRWDQRFIRQELGKHGFKKIQKVWVCGPPVMNETFDRVLSGHEQAAAGGGAVQESDSLLGGGSVGLTPDQYEIL